MTISDERRRRIRPQNDNVSTRHQPGRDPERDHQILQARIRDHLGYVDSISAQYLPEIHDNINRRGAGGMARQGIYPHGTPSQRGGHPYENMTHLTVLEEGILVKYKVVAGLEGESYTLVQGTLRHCSQWTWDHLSSSPHTLALEAWERRTQPRGDRS